jgi:hypothetical protein
MPTEAETRVPEVRRIWGDIGWVAILTPSPHAPEHAMDVRAWRIAAEGPDGVEVGDSDHGFTADWLSAKPEIEGSIKWDGCSNLDIGDADRPGCMWHHCDREGLVAVGTVLGRLFDEAMALMPTRYDEKWGREWADTPVWSGP